MDVKELIKSARALLEEANKAIENGDLELAETKQTEYQDMEKKIKMLDANTKSAKALKDLEPEDEPVTPIRPPFETDNDVQVDEKDALNKAFYVTKYGELDNATKAFTKDLYGNDYYQQRQGQWNAFAKYVRTGKLNSQEDALLNKIILVPEAISSQIKSGHTVADVKASVLQEGVNDLGGVLVPEDYRLEIIKRMAGLTIMRGRARQVNTMRDAAEWPKIEGGDSQYTSAVRVTWIDELPADANATLTNPTFGMYRIPVHTAMARTDISKNMLEDTPFNMLMVLADLFAEAAAIDEDARFLTATGVGTPRGILGNRSGANETPETGITSVNSGDASTLTADGLIDLVYTLAAQYRRQAVHIAEKATLQVIRKLKDGTGDYLWARGLQVGEPSQLLGYSVLEDESMPSIAANYYPLVFGDLSGYLIVDRVGMTIQRVEDTNTVGGNKVAIFMRRRLGGQVVEPWKFVAQKVSA